MQVRASFSDEVRRILVAASDGTFACDTQPLARFNVFVIAKAVDRDAAAEDVRVLALDAVDWSEATEARIAGLGGSVSNRHMSAFEGFAAALLSLPGAVAEARLREAVEASGARIVDLDFVGSHAARTVLAERRETERTS